MKANAIRLGVAALATVAVLGTAAPAFAQRHHHHGGNNAAGAAAIGLLGGLALGAAISNPAPPPPVYYAPAPAYVAPAPVYTRSPHTDWCAANTPGYNAYDNTYQGYYAGERILCRSPYGG